MKKYMFPLLALGLMTVACVDDEGNYNYSSLNTVEIAGIAERYPGLAYFDNIVIKPELEGSVSGLDLSYYTYTWTICRSGHNHTVISTEKDLDWPANVPPGTYTLYFTVKDTSTGLEKNQSTTVVLSNPYTRGFLVLGDDMTDNRVRIDMISMPTGRDTVLIENVFENPGNIHGARNLLYSGPGGLADHQDVLWLLTDDDSYKMTFKDDFRIIGGLSDFDFIEIGTEHKTPMQVRDVYPHMGRDEVGFSMNRSRNYRGMIFDDVVVICYNSYNEYYSQAINRYNASVEKYFKPYPMAFVRSTQQYTTSEVKLTLYYDLDSQRFARCQGAYTYFVKEVPDYNPGEWSINLGTNNRSLVYAENGLNKYQGYNPSYLISKDNDADNYYISYFSWKENMLNPQVGVTLFKSRLYRVDQAVATDFSNASHYMFSSNNSMLLYSVGNRLYMYDYARGACSHYDFDGEITYLESDYPSAGSIKDYFVATYDQASGKGMIYKMEVSERYDAGFTFLPDQQWETTMRVTDIEWKES